jgi:hypothetical protein
MLAFSLAPLAGGAYVMVLLPALTRASLERNHITPVARPEPFGRWVIPLMMLGTAVLFAALPAVTAWWRGCRVGDLNDNDVLTSHALAVATLAAAIAAAVRP